jgi:hypothetical protein
MMFALMLNRQIEVAHDLVFRIMLSNKKAKPVPYKFYTCLFHCVCVSYCPKGNPESKWLLVNAMHPNVFALVYNIQNKLQSFYQSHPVV